MPARIREHQPDDEAAVVRLSLRAWAPVFASLEQVLEKAGYTPLPVARYFQAL